jgi:hypothetical protein
MSFFLRNTVGEAPTTGFYFLIIRTQIYIREDLNLGGWVVHPLSYFLLMSPYFCIH